MAHTCAHSGNPVNTCTLDLGRMKDSLANVARQRVRLGRYYGGGLMLLSGGELVVCRACGLGRCCGDL